jgi:dienelactone hydrolase
VPTDATGSTSANRGVILIYDIFGFYPQTLKGADRLAQHLDGLALVPDLLEGQTADPSWFPADTPEKQASLEAFSTVASPPANLEKLRAVVVECKSKYPTVEKWAVVGLCWGAKVNLAQVDE